MFKNSAIQVATSKLASTSLLPSSLILIGGVVVWRLWRKQTQLSNETNELSNELEDIKDQLAEIKTDGESADPLSSSLKKLASFNPWSSSK